MSTLSLADLVTADPTPFSTAAEAWQGLAGDIDKAVDKLIEGARDLPYAWERGDAAEACATRTGEVKAEVNAAYNPAERISDALSHHAYALVDLREQAKSLIADAQKVGCAVDLATGTVSVLPRMTDYSMPGAKEAEQRAIADAQSRAQSFADQLGTVLSRARALDDSTVNTITANLPDPTTGFGMLSFQAVTREDVTNQRGRDPKQVKEWWESLTPEQRAQAVRDFPDLVGWLDGVPAIDRNAANRLRLDNDQARLSDERTALEREIAELRRGGRAYDDSGQSITKLQDRLGQVRKELAGLEMVERRVNDLGDRGFLLGVDPSRDGKAIVAVGNPDLANNIATYVPGTGAGFVGGEGFAGNLDRAQRMALDASKAAPDERTSVVLWIGYDAPDNAFLNAPSDDYAEDAAPDLRRFQGGLRATHEAGDASQTVLGHSYGTTVVGHAASHGHSLDADQVVFVASPGVGVEEASDLSLRNGDTSGERVWATCAEGDKVRYSPVHNNDPTEDDFGGKVFESRPGGHGSYWDQNNVARANIANLVVGNDSAVR